MKTAGGQGCESRRGEGQKHGVPWTRRLPSECGNGVESRPCPGCHGPRGQRGSAWHRLGSPMARRENPRCGRCDCGRFCLASACAVFRAPLALRMLCGKPVEETEETSARAMLERDPARESPPRWGLSLSAAQHPRGAGRGAAVHPTPGRPLRPRPPARPAPLARSSAAGPARERGPHWQSRVVFF